MYVKQVRYNDKEYSYREQLGNVAKSLRTLFSTSKYESVIQRSHIYAIYSKYPPVTPTDILFYSFAIGQMAVIFATLLLMACSNPSEIPKQNEPGSRLTNDQTADAIPVPEPRSRYGNPPFYDVWSKRYYVMDSSKDYVARGIASWYGEDFQGQRTSSGETYDMYAMTAAHKELPLPTYVQVTNLENKRTAVVRINDRGPFHENRLIDLSYAAATKLGIVQKGTGLVEVRALDPNHPQLASITPLRNANTLVTNPQMYIQVGAFASRQNAERLQIRLEPHQLGKISIIPSNHQKKPIFRVRIGPLASVELADQTTKRLNNMGMREYQIVID
jgi:rare lipoprotein A